jgi:hypothetical protein
MNISVLSSGWLLIHGRRIPLGTIGPCRIGDRRPDIGHRDLAEPTCSGESRAARPRNVAARRPLQGFHRRGFESIGAQRIDAQGEQEVARVDGGKLDPNEDLVGAGSVGLGNVDILKTVDRVAKSCELNSTLLISPFNLDVRARLASRLLRCAHR